MFKIVGLMLLFTLGYSLGLREDPQWCYCTMCGGGVPYCKTYGGSCYTENINNSFFAYGCLEAELTNITCNLNYSINYDRSEHIYTRDILCCKGIEWCNANPKTLAKLYDRLPNIQRENDFDKQSCYCNVCGKNKMCLTNGYCYRDLSTYASPVYGCLHDLSCPNIHYNHLKSNFYDPTMQCCAREKWCNFDVERILEFNMLDVDSELKIRWIRFERLGYYRKWLTYRMIARNRIGGKILVNFKNLSLNTEQPIEFNMTNGSFDFGISYNKLYKFQLQPYIGNYLIESIRVFYLATLYRANVTWFQDTDIYYNTSVRTVVICGICNNHSESFKCRLCTIYSDPDMNPINLPEWS